MKLGGGRAQGGRIEYEARRERVNRYFSSYHSVKHVFICLPL
jgi:hypothetical protein